MPDKTMSIPVYRVGRTFYLCVPHPWDAWPDIITVPVPDLVSDWEFEVATWPGLVASEVGNHGASWVEFDFQDGTELN